MSSPLPNTIVQVMQECTEPSTPSSSMIGADDNGASLLAQMYSGQTLTISSLVKGIPPSPPSPTRIDYM